MKKNILCSNKKGFSLIMVVMLSAVMSMSSVLVLNLVGFEKTLSGIDQRAREAKEVAQEGVAEIINDGNLATSAVAGFGTITNALPTLDQPETTYTPSTDSFYQRHDDPNRVHGDYAAQISLERVVPIAESSQNLVRAVIYRLEVSSEVGDYGAGVEASVFRISTAKQGVVLPKTYAR